MTDTVADHLAEAVAQVSVRFPDFTSESDRVAAAAEACDTIAYGAGLLWADDKALRAAVRQKKREGTPDLAAAMAAVTTGLAVLAHRERGVNFGGKHWSSRYPDGLGVYALPRPASGIGVHYTPPALARELVEHTLAPVTHLYDTTTGTWSVPLTAPQILDKTMCDPTCGAGAMLVAGARYLADRVVDAWTRADVLGPDPRRLALRLVVSRCVYGVDLEPVAVALARLALRLLVPLDDVDTRIAERVRHGDSLIGITSLDQLRHLHLDGAASGTVPLDERDPALWREIVAAVDARVAERTA